MILSPKKPILRPKAEAISWQMQGETKAKISMVELGFMEARAKLIDVAAFLDRVDRYQQASDGRVEALKKAVPLLLAESTGRVEEVLKSFSDPSTEPIEKAHTQGAVGAYLEANA